MAEYDFNAPRLFVDARLQAGARIELDPSTWRKNRFASPMRTLNAGRTLPKNLASRMIWLPLTELGSAPDVFTRLRYSGC